VHENILLTDEKLFTIEKQNNNQNNKIYVQTSLVVRSEGAGRPSTLLRHGLVGGVPSGGDTSSLLLERGETDVRVYQEDVLQDAVKQLNMTFFSGQEWVFQQDSVPAQKTQTTQEWLRRKLLAFISAENWLSGSADLKTLENKTVGCFRGHGMPRTSQQPGEPKEIPCKGSDRDPPGDGACGNNRVAGASQRLRQGIGLPFLLTLLQIKI